MELLREYLKSLMYIHFPLYLTEALNKSSVPTLWKAAVVLPIQKKKSA